MRRIAFAVLLTLSLALAPLAAEGQQTGTNLPRIGYLSAGSESPRDVAFRQGLRELGYIDGKNIAIEYRFAEGKFERLAGFAAELVRLKVDVIVASSTPANRAAQQATQTIPIVIALGELRATPISNIARPSGNTTGLNAINDELGGKRLELIREVLPRLTRVAVIRNPNNVASATQLADTEAGARALRLQIQLLDLRGPDDFEKAFEAAVRQRADAVFGLPDTMLTVHRKQLAELAAKHRLPTMYPTREHPEAGSLMSYGPNIPDLFRRAASYVDKILKGAKPGDLPIEQPVKFELVINRKTAKALGLTIPQTLLLQADQVIE
jgi:putative tryptophan/tyrosine transport system substrate-binding protein